MPPVVAVAGQSEPADTLALANKRELARVLDCSLPTVTELLDRYPDFPVERRGTNGLEWQFDVAKVQAFLSEKREAEQRDDEARRDLFRQFSLPFAGYDNGAPGGAPLSASAMLAMARTRQVDTKLAREAGLLVPTSEVRQNITPALTRFMRLVDAMPRSIGSRFNLPDAVTTAMRSYLDEERRALVAELERLYEGGP